MKTPPKGLGILLVVGPGLVWCSEMIGSGEVILTTRVGSILGIGVIWAIVAGIFLKYWIGLGGARYTVCTGEGMIDMFSRIPGPKNWVVWTVLVVHLIVGAVSMGAIAKAAGIFVSSLIPGLPASIGPLETSKWAGFAVSVAAVFVSWYGGFRILKIIMSLFVLIIILGVLYVAGTVFPPFSEFLLGFLPQVPEVPDWAIAQGLNPNPWREILPLMGWAAGGFASQVWYTYWVLGEGYGAASGRGYGKPADLIGLKRMDREGAEKIRGWSRVVVADATVALLVTTVITISFLIAGAGVLRANEVAPEGPELAITLSRIFSSTWARVGGFLFILTGATALSGTLMAQMAGWPRMLADCFRICIPGFNKALPWKTQYGMFLILFFFTNMFFVFLLGKEPVALVQFAAIADGLLLTPLQAIWVAVGLYYILPRIYPKETFRIIRPHWIYGLMLSLAFLVFGFFFAYQVPQAVKSWREKNESQKEEVRKQEDARHDLGVSGSGEKHREREQPVSLKFGCSSPAIESDSLQVTKRPRRGGEVSGRGDGGSPLAGIAPSWLLA